MSNISWTPANYSSYDGRVNSLRLFTISYRGGRSDNKQWWLKTTLPVQSKAIDGYATRDDAEKAAAGLLQAFIKRITVTAEQAAIR